MRLFILFIISLFLFSCVSSEENNISFYHWKNESSLSKIEKDYLKSLAVKQLYFRFFDVDVNENNEVYPISVIREIDSAYKSYQVIPVVFITNRTFKSTLTTTELANKVRELINQMYKHHFDTIPHKVQIDCDWTGLTQEKYFDFLKELQNNFEVSVTLRLHQIKYKEKTGVPPVKEGTLMVYNMGELTDFSENSIFSEDLLKKYINKNTSYSLDLDMALPLYSWGVVKFSDGSFKIINSLKTKDLEGVLENYKKEDDNSFRVIKPHFLRGFYLTAGTLLKIEEVDYNEILRTKKYLQSCKGINWNSILLYHLDEALLKEYTINQLLELK